MGAFGLNASILDAANVAWKVGLVAKNKAKLETLLPTYGSERRGHAVRIIEVSGSYLRFVTGSSMPVPNLWDIEALNTKDKATTNGASATNGNSTKLLNGDSPQSSKEKAMEFLGAFFKAHGQFLLGVDCVYGSSALAPSSEHFDEDGKPPLKVRNGARAPNPRLCFAKDRTGYLYDTFAGPPRFHLVVFASSLSGVEVRRRVAAFADALEDPDGFYQRFGGSERFNIVVVVKGLPFEVDDALGCSEFDPLRRVKAHILSDDRAPDEDAHTTWGAHHEKGGLAVIRPDLWVGTTAFPDDTKLITEYFDGFLKA